MMMMMMMMMMMLMMMKFLTFYELAVHLNERMAILKMGRDKIRKEPHINFKDFQGPWP